MDSFSIYWLAIEVNPVLEVFYMSKKRFDVRYKQLKSLGFRCLVNEYYKTMHN